MSVSIIHISDLHLRKGWAEEQGDVLKEFFTDLKTQAKQLENVHLIFTGDILQSGDDNALYELFTYYFQSEFDEIGITKNRLIFLPGNHDVDRDYTAKKLSVLKGMQERSTNESNFNSNIYAEQRDLILPKFEKFLKWQSQVSSFNLSSDTYSGAGFAISDEIGIYCLNTALYSFGGLNDESGKEIDDKGFLPIETRKLHQWLQETKFKYRILAMHHPKSWLVDWAKIEIERIENRNFDLILCGHTHEQSAFHTSDGTNSVIECVSPPLFTRKRKPLGYSILHIDEVVKSTQVRYRQWTGKKFVTGTILSNTDDGVVRFGAGSDGTENTKKVFDAVQHSLKNNFDESLKCYASLPDIWIMPNIANVAEFSSARDAIIQPADQLTVKLKDSIIKAPPQFGLSSLGRFIAWKSWMDRPGQYVLYLYSPDLPSHESGIKAVVENSLLERGLSKEDLHAIILDEPLHIAHRKINNIKKQYPNLPLLILNRIEYTEQLDKPMSGQIDHEYEEYYLWSLDREQIRDLVKQFIAAGKVLDEESATQHLVDDLENLNLHRSPLNCITLLAIYEKQIDYSPANRTEMLERFLYLLFAAYKKTPDYSNYPDMKDSFYVLGEYCEKLIREEVFEFSKTDFIVNAVDYCRRMALDIDVSLLFDLMLKENVIIGKDNKYYFRYSYWIYFFAAHRMYHDESFKDYILSNSKYVKAPEIIEFYSGIDRRRDELLELLINDLERLNSSFEERTKIGSAFDPYSFAKWEPSSSQINEMKAHVESEIRQSSLPVSVKDRIADHGYDKSRPYIQEFNAFIKDSSFRECTLIMKASARALRNSDYVDKEIKVRMLSEIMRSWSKIIQVMVILSPILAKDKHARFENVGFYLGHSWPEFDDEGELWSTIMDLIPWNAVNYHEKDLSSARMGPLLIEFLEISDNEIARFIVACCLLRQKPRGWLSGLKKYMMKMDKNSFYLSTMFNDIRAQYKHGFYNSKQKKELEELLGVAIAKHELGSKKPSGATIKKVAKSVVDQIRSEE